MRCVISMKRSLRIAADMLSHKSHTTERAWQLKLFNVHEETIFLLSPIHHRNIFLQSDQNVLVQLQSFTEAINTDLKYLC